MRKKTWIVVGGAVLLAAASWFFAPWKLFIDERADEAAPAAARLVAGGVFRSLEHQTTGTAAVIEEAGGSLTLRLEELRTSNGPDLVVILSPTPATDDSWTAYGEGDTLALGPLKGNLGSSNYALPSGTDLGRYKSAVIWCRRFGVAFGAAPLATRVAAQ
jgi:hypothetical protein